MEELTHWEKKANGWVFLSHSSRDYEEVKIIRNYLEDNGFSALMFYLKCLEEEKNLDLIHALISEEIKARNIFVLCDSVYSRKSDWVALELKEVHNKKNKTIIKNIEMSNLKYKRATALSVLDDLINLASLYLIYHSDDSNKVDKIDKVLNSKGYRVFKNNPKETSQRKDKAKYFNSAIEETPKEGTILIFLSSKVLNSRWFWNEKDIALNRNSEYIIPILLDNVSIDRFPAFVNSDYIIRYEDYYNNNNNNRIDLDMIINDISINIELIQNIKK